MGIASEDAWEGVSDECASWGLKFRKCHEIQKVPWLSQGTDLCEIYSFNQLPGWGPNVRELRPFG